MMRKPNRTRRNITPAHGTGMIAYEDRESWLIPSSIGQQIFTISSGIAGGLAGFLLAAKLADSTHVQAKGLMLASAISALATFGVVFMISGAYIERET